MKWLALSIPAIVTLAHAGDDPGQEGRKALQEGRLEAARRSFEIQLAKHPGDSDALVGAGFTALRQERALDARDYFARAAMAAPNYADAPFGLALCAERFGQIAEAKARIRQALAIEPARAEFQQTLTRLLSEEPEVPAPIRPLALDLRFRSRPGGFEVLQAGGWKPIFLKGINLGAALPGKYPSEFPDKATYQAWIRDMAELGVNCIRVYTVHPPAFYEALREHNLKASKPIYLVHGVWTELPPDDNFRDPTWLGDWVSEMKRVVDLLHGRAWIKPQPGHADGFYQADVSPWTLAYILGREWEPFSVVAFNGRHPGLADWKGRFLRITQGHATEVFMAEALDTLIAYEHDTYHAQRPAAFTNWPTLDPLTHPTESTKAEEASWRSRLQMALEKGQKIQEFDNDAIGLDMEKFDPSPGFEAGLFASFHAYPYYPDFMNLDPDYGKARDHEGPSNYYGYLRDLVHWHRKYPVLIAEFGVPSSRLVAHWQAQGVTHGGQDEILQGKQDARMFREIRDAGCAGGLLFAWIDEWFKKNWLVIDFEEPLDRKPYWYNMQDAEENYGLLGYQPGAQGPTILIDGRSGDWDKVPVYMENQDLRLKFLADEGWLHLGIFFKGAEPDWSKEGFLVGLDTHDLRLGDHQLPFGLPLESEAGLEFAVLFQGDRTALYVDEPYDLFTHRYLRPYRSQENHRGRFLMPQTESNRMRIGRDGTIYPAHRQDIGFLKRGTQDRSDPAFDSRAEWNGGPGFIEARIPWGLLNVTDPSSRLVVQDAIPPSDGVGTVKTDGFRAVLVRFEGRAASGDVRPLATLPEPRNGFLPAPPLFTWAEWTVPTFHHFRKRSFSILKEALAALPDTPRPPR